MTAPPYVPPAPRVVDADGPVHVADYGGPAGAPLLVGVHGLGGSHLNWAAVAPYLTDRYRLQAIDLLGHGRTPTAGRTPDVAGHVALLAGTLAVLSEDPVVVLGNSLGGLVSALCAAGASDRIAGLVLVDPALPTGRIAPVHPRIVTNFVVCSLPGVGERYLAARRARTTPEQTVRRVLGVTCVDPARVPADVVDAHVELTASVDRARGDAAYLVSARSLSRVMARPGPTLARLATLDVPVLHLHGDRDVLVPLASARRMAEGRSDWRLEIARDIGHAPMLEAPVWTALRIGRWLDADGAAARTPAGRPTGSVTPVG
ncbi:MAG TPA: alpha/beta hydrolase [Acidimicrobiales bacterium]|nr:alpha/beta hydrolase [Acidimicrobiales bacterium]